MPITAETFTTQFRENDCGNIDCSDYVLNGSYITEVVAGVSYMSFSLKFSRPRDQPIANSPNFRFGFWIDSGTLGSEAMSCGYGYDPLLETTFGCISYNQPYDIVESWRSYTYSNFSNI